MQRALEGDEQAFDLLYERYAPMVARRLRRILRVANDTEDVLQATFLEVFRTLGRYRPEASFAAWVQAIAYRVLGTYLRARRRRRWLSFGEHELDRVVGPSCSAEDQAYHRQVANKVWRILEGLSDDKRVAWALHELEGLGVTEIAGLLGASPQTVSARVQSARRDVLSALRAWEGLRS